MDEAFTAIHGSTGWLLAADAVGGGSVGWLLFELVLILGVIGLVGWLAIRALGGRQGATTGQPVRVLARQALGPQEQLLVLAVRDDRALLVARSASGMQTLAELDADDLDALGLSSDEATPTPPRSFGEVLRALRGKD